MIRLIQRLKGWWRYKTLDPETKKIVAKFKKKYVRYGMLMVVKETKDTIVSTIEARTDYYGLVVAKGPDITDFAIGDRSQFVGKQVNQVHLDDINEDVLLVHYSNIMIRDNGK